MILAVSLAALARSSRLDVACYLFETSCALDTGAVEHLAHAAGLLIPSSSAHCDRLRFLPSACKDGARLPGRQITLFPDLPICWQRRGLPVRQIGFAASDDLFAFAHEPLVTLFLRLILAVPAPIPALLQILTLVALRQKLRSR